MIKLVACDLDGTLLNKNGLISDYTSKTIKNYQKEVSLLVSAQGGLF